MRRWLLLSVLCTSGSFAAAQQPAVPVSAPDAQVAEAEPPPLPDIRELLLDVERNERHAEAQQQEYTYHVHSVQQELDGKGNVKKTVVRDSESLTIDGVRVDKLIARDGKPLTPEEAKKEDEHIDAAVAKAKAARAEREAKGQPTDARGDQVLTASRILELGTFSNPRRVDLKGRPTIVADYAGDPNAKTHSSFEGVVRDLVGTIWIDERDHFLVQAQGHFLNDFKIGGGLVADIRKGSNFEIQFTRVNDEVWLPAVIEGQGKARILLVSGFNGRVHVVTTDYRKFRTSATIVSGGNIVPPDTPALPAGSQPPQKP